MGPSPERQGSLELGPVRAVICLAMDPMIVELLGQLKYLPDGSPMEQPVPDLMKKLVTRGVDSLLEGMVRKQVHSLMQVAFHKVRMPHGFC